MRTILLIALNYIQWHCGRSENETEYHKYLNEASDAWDKLVKMGISQEQKDIIENIERASPV